MVDARALALRLSQADGIDAALERDHLDAIVAPSYSLATTPAAVAGYPNISVPVGLADAGHPAGIWIYGGFLQEPKLLGFAYDLEQELQARSAPRFQGQLPPEPPDAGLCQPRVHGQSKQRHLRHLGTGRQIGH
jgi:amidase